MNGCRTNHWGSNLLTRQQTIQLIPLASGVQRFRRIFLRSFGVQWFERPASGDEIPQEFDFPDQSHPSVLEHRRDTLMPALSRGRGELTDEQRTLFELANGRPQGALDGVAFRFAHGLA